MQENNDKMDVGWMDTDDLKKHHKRGRIVWFGIPVSLFLFFSLLLFAMLGLVAILPVAIAAFLFFKFAKQVSRLPKWLYTTAFLILALLTWIFFANGPFISNRVATWIYRTSGFDVLSGEPTVLVSEDAVPPARAQTAQTDTDWDTPASEATPENADPDPATEPAAPANGPVTELSATANQQAFDTYIRNGLKAVEDEDYSVANQNFKNAFRANPQHPRLQQLAAEFRKSADEKCQDFKNANARELSHIPNNYYQYAASLTQTVPLKCD